MTSGAGLAYCDSVAPRRLGPGRASAWLEVAAVSLTLIRKCDLTEFVERLRPRYRVVGPVAAPTFRGRRKAGSLSTSSPTPPACG
jgi:hypothetical protein